MEIIWTWTNASKWNATRSPRLELDARIPHRGFSPIYELSAVWVMNWLYRPLKSRKMFLQSNNGSRIRGFNGSPREFQL